METSEGILQPDTETTANYPYAAIVVAPYTREDKGPDAKTRYTMSHFTARSALAGAELYDQKMAPLIVIPGEQKNPATSDLEKKYYIEQKHIPAENIIDFPNLNGTLQQLEPIAKLQKEGKLGKILVVGFEFHNQRIKEYMDMLGIDGDIAEVEKTHVDYLQSKNPNREIRANRDELINLPQLEKVKNAEHGISRKILAVDKIIGKIRPLKSWAPATRLSKLLMGPTVTGIRGYEGSTGKKAEAMVSLVRIDQARNALNQVKEKFLDKKVA